MKSRYSIYTSIQRPWQTVSFGTGYTTVLNSYFMQRYLYISWLQGLQDKVTHLRTYQTTCRLFDVYAHVPSFIWICLVYNLCWFDHICKIALYRFEFKPLSIFLILCSRTMRHAPYASSVSIKHTHFSCKIKWYGHTQKWQHGRVAYACHS